MRIEKINEDKLKIMFNEEELEENNITVHSFLAGSNEAQKLFLAILDIANEEFGFDIKNCNVSSETISFGNKNFVILITKKSLSASMPSKNIGTFSHYNLLNLVDYDHTTSINPLSFQPPLNHDCIMYKFSTLDEVFNFCKFVNLELSIKNLTNSLYKYNDDFYIIIDMKKLATSQKELVINILSEYKEYIYLSMLSLDMFLEKSTLLLENNAIQSL